MKMHINHLEVCSVVSEIYLSLPGLKKGEITFDRVTSRHRSCGPGFFIYTSISSFMS